MANASRSQIIITSPVALSSSSRSVHPATPGARVPIRAILPTPERTICSGWLQKRCRHHHVRRKGQRWKDRWFALRDTGLGYYKNEKEYALIRIIPLETVTDIAIIHRHPTTKSKDPIIRLSTTKRTFYLRAPTLNTANHWACLLMRQWQTTQRQLVQYSWDDDDDDQADDQEDEECLSSSL